MQNNVFRLEDKDKVEDKFAQKVLHMIMIGRESEKMEAVNFSTKLNNIT